jgi:hypothetical protein
MSLDDFSIACFCLIDDPLPSILIKKRLRSRGPRPKLAVSLVITLEVVGASLLISQERALSEYFRQHSAHVFPALSQLHRSSFVQQESVRSRCRQARGKRSILICKNDSTERRLLKGKCMSR